MGKTDRFPFVAEITLPYDPSWGEEVFVQYYDKSTKQWSIIWSEPDGKGNVTFWTDHFSIYATFRKMVQGENGWGDYADSWNNSRLFVPTADNKTPISFEQLTPTTRCMLDVAALAKYIRNNSVDMGAVKPGAKDTAGLESAINILNNTGSFGATYLDALDFVGGTSYFDPLTDVIGYVGYAFTVSKILMQAYRTGNFLQAVSDHQLDLAGIALSVGAKVTTGATATCLNLAAFVLLMKGAVDSVGQYVDLLGAENKTEYAYRLFTTMHLTYLPKSDRISVKYGKNDYEKLNQLWQPTEISLRATRPTIGNPTYSNWEVTFESIFKKNKNQPKKVVATINKLLDMYCNAFWQLEDSNSKTYRKFLKETRSGVLSLDKMIDVYKKPTDEERAVYSARLKNDLIVWLSPMINEYAKKAYIEMLNLILRNAYALQDELNKTVTFTIVDVAPKKNDITINSGMKPYHPPKNLSNIRMRQFRTDKELWEFTKENKYTVKCTPYAFMAVGMPKFIDFYYAEEDTPVTIKIAPTLPKTYIPMGENEYPTLAEIEGVYADGKTVVASADNTGVFTKIFSGIQKSLEDAGWKPSDDSGADSSEKMPFSLVVTGKNSGDFYKYEEPEDNDYYDNPGGGTVPVRSGTFKYNEKKGELKLKFQFEDDIEVSGTLYCTYSADKKTVLVSGEVSGRVLVVVKFSVNISGSKER